MKCNATDCIYNAQSICRSDIVRISAAGNDAYCDTHLCGGNNKKYYGQDTEFGADQGITQVLCTASRCSYNKAFKCCAKDTQIEDPKGSNICGCSMYRSK